MPLLAAKLLDLREEHGYSQQFVANYLNMSREGYCNYERAAREPGLDIILKLCILYQIKVGDLVNSNTVFPSAKLQKIFSTGKKGNTISDKDSNALPSQTDQKPEHQAKSYVEKNMEHFLKLLSGKIAKVDFTDLTKEDITFLIEYKELEEQEQEELREFLHFKQYYKKRQGIKK